MECFLSPQAFSLPDHDPVQLSCGHSHCRSCTLDMNNHRYGPQGQRLKGFFCPTCRVRILYMTTEYINAMPTNTAALARGYVSIFSLHL